MKHIIKILENKGAMLSADLSVELQNTLNITSATARKRIERAISKPNSPIKYILNLNFPHNARFIYLKKDEKNQLFFENLYLALNKTNSVYAHSLNTLIAKNGIIKWNRFRILSGSPDKIVGHLSYRKVLQRLLDIDICRTFEQNGEQYIKLMDNDETSEESAYAQNKIEEIIISSTKDWLKKMGLVSYRTVDVKNEFGSFGWDITAPSYISPFRNGEKHGFVVTDVIFNIIDEDCLKYFLHKVKIIKSQKNMYPFIPILIAKFFTKEAYALGKSYGLILVTPEVLFGEKTGELLNNLLKCLTNAASVAINDLEKFMDIYDQLSKIKGASINLQGDLFEFITAHCVKQIFEGSIDIGKRISIPGELSSKEIDVMLVTNTNSLYFFECKGYNIKNRITKEEIEYWLEKIKFVWKWLKEQRKDLMGRKIIFEFITTSDFYDDAKMLLDEEKTKVKKYSISYKNGEDFINFINESNLINMNKIIKTLKQHYLNLTM